ncbi:hypothetical protein HanRHA438_Chr00c35g0855871 [Helianthus annuus]|nr:hypothetical protein HanRHA438_Chr00c35g0855871 [Helianthus annuus]
MPSPTTRPVTTITATMKMKIFVALPISLEEVTMADFSLLSVMVDSLFKILPELNLMSLEYCTGCYA